MLKIHQLFLRSFSLVFLLILIATGTATYFWVKKIYIEQVEKNLTQNIDSLSIALVNLNNLDTIVAKLREKVDLRITIINHNGVVISDSHKDKSLLENHGEREEIIHAKYDGFGSAIRLSESVNKELIYVAKKVEVGEDIIYVRMADDLKSLRDSFIKLSAQVTGIFGIFLLLTFIITYVISSRIKIETDNILDFLTKITKKEPLVDVSSNFTLEFYQITELLKKVATRLSKREKQKAKHTAKLKRSNKQKDEIISAISHEFKNPIAIISGYSETILHDPDLPPSMTNKFLQKIHSNANKMSTIIDRLRLSLTLEEGKTTNYVQKCNIKAMCEEIVSDLEQKYPNRTMIVEGHDLELDVDDTMFQIAIGNLIENALKYSELEVTIRINRNSINVIDKGLGISEEDVKKITTKFYRVSQNGWNNSLGLGLFIVYRIIALHKFKLVIDSELGKGSTFKILF